MTISSLIQQLPPQTTPFVGRWDALSHIADLLADPACRLLTLVGPGGMGKTRLALQTAANLIADFPDGVYFVALQPLASETLIVPTIGEALGLQFQPDREPGAQLLNYLSGKTLLLLLDNFEHLLAAPTSTQLISDLLARAPALKLLVTSRERLNMREEWVYEVGGLSFPTSDTDSVTEDFSAVQLFSQNARRVDPNFSLADHAAAVARICVLLEGAPLALELASSWVHVLSCAEIADEIARGSDILETSARDVPERHRSMRAVLNHSWNLLSLPEREVFARLSVFRGGFRRDAAEPVAGAALSTLAALVNKSWLRHTPDGRYDIHELLRQYGDTQLQASGQHEAARDTHSTYYAEFVSQRTEDLKGRRQLEAMAEINADFENVRTAWNWAAAHRQAKLIEQMIDGLYVSCGVRGRYHEGMTCFQFAQQAFAPSEGEAPSALWGRLLARAADVDATSAQAQLDLALQIAQSQNAPAEVAFCLGTQAQIAYGEQDFIKSRTLLEQSLTIRRALGDRFWIAEVMWMLQTNSYESNWQDFQRFGQEGLRLRQEIGDRVGAAWSLSAVAHQLSREGYYAEAERLWLERIALGREIGNLSLIALGCAHVSYAVYFVTGEFTKSRAAAEEGLRVATMILDTNAAGWTLTTLGLLAGVEGRYQEALGLFQQAASKKGLAWATDLAAWGKAITFCGLGDYEAARQCCQASFQHILNMPGMLGLVAYLPIIAMLSAQQGDHLRAVELLALAFTHPVRAYGWMEKWTVLAHFRFELERMLRSEAYAAAWEKGSRLDVDLLTEVLRQQFTVESADASNSTLQASKELLTARELEILRLVTDGLSNRDIAAKLFLAPTTIKWYLNEVYSKLGVKSRTQAANRARALRLID